MYQALRSLAVLPDDEQAYLLHQKNELDKRLIARREKEREERQQELAGAGSKDRSCNLHSRLIGIPRKTSKQNIGSSSTSATTTTTTSNSPHSTSYCPPSSPSSSSLSPSSLQNPTPTLTSAVPVNQNLSLGRNAEIASDANYEKEKLLPAVHAGDAVCRIAFG